MTEKEILKRISQLIKPHRGRLGIAMIGMVMVAGLSASQAYMVKPLLDDIFFKQDRLIFNILPFALVMFFLINGLDIRDVSLSALRKQIALVTQHTILLNDTAKNNIAYGDPDCPEEKIIATARAANVLEFIEQLPQGPDTVKSC